MSDEDLKARVERLERELAEARRYRHKEESTNAFAVILWLISVVGIGYWLFHGGFGQVARFLFWMGVFQR